MCIYMSFTRLLCARGKKYKCETVLTEEPAYIFSKKYSHRDCDTFSSHLQ